MLQKIISIKNIGRFRDCKPCGDVTFRKLTLIFAENGRGKTTLCGILRSLQTGQPEFILERKTLGTNDPLSVQILLGANSLTFKNNAWPATNPNISIFDSVFVHDNVYAGDYVDHEHKKNLYRVIVGEQGVHLAKQIEGLDEKIRDANKEIKSKREVASVAIPKGTPLEKYLAWEPVNDIVTKIQEKKTEIANRQHTLEKKAEIQSKGLLSKITLPAFPSDFLTILSKQLADITSDAEGHVRQQVNAHNMGKQGEPWLSQGLTFVADDKCPFCGQSININELVAAYRSHFNAAYKALKQEVAQLSKRVTEAIGESSLNVAQQILSSNLTLVEFWKQFAPVVLPDFTFDDVRDKYATLLNLASSLAIQKQQSPTEPTEPGSDFRAAIEAVTSCRECVEPYNTAVERSNAIISERKFAAQQGLDVQTLQKELADLEAKRKRFEPEVVHACKEYMDALNAKAALEQQKAAAREQLDSYCQQILQTCQSTINTYLEQFSTGFRITNSRHLYTGGTPSSHYQIEINSCEVDLGDSRTQPGLPCFKTTLSSGDRSALALAFFLAAMNQDTSIGDKIVVLDDPFTSQDRFRRTCTQQLIRQLAGKAKQVIVLSHDPHFLKLIWEGYPANDIKVLQLCRVGDSTVIGEWDIESETQSDYLKNYSALLEFYRDRKGVVLNVARSIRPFLEGLFRAHFPGHFKSTEWLGNFIDKIRAADNNDGLYHAKPDLPEIEAINDYSKRYHHDQNPHADSEPISVEELHGFVKRTLRFIGGC